MNKYFVLITILSFSFFYTAIAASNDTISQSIVKVKTYEYNPFTETYVLLQYGSAVYLGDGKLITNAHVVIDEKEEPTGLYEICFTVDVKKEPTCTTNAILKTYDATSDLALLQIQPIKGLTGLKFADSGDPSIGSNVAIYGYPAIGGATITRTEGVLAGYEDNIYKIDATIDHGNSGGGAFNKDGNLIGIPQAIKKDNAVIGYIIPSSIVQDFLLGKMRSTIKYTQKGDSGFPTFLKIVQGILKNPKNLTDGKIKIGDFSKYGFTLTSYARVKDNSSFSYAFSEKNKRVSLYFSCTKDSGYMESWKIRQEDILNEKKRYERDRNISYEEDRSFYTVKSEAKSPSEKSQDNSISVYFKKYDSCFSTIRYINPIKDKGTIDKALGLIKSIKVPENYKLNTKYTSPFFTLSSIPKGSFISDSINESSNRIITIMVKVAENTWASGDIGYMKITKMDDYYNLPFLSGDKEKDNKIIPYTGEYSLETLRQRFDLYINSNFSIISHSLNNKPFIFTRKYDDMNYNGIINFFYPYKLKTGEYGALYGTIDDTLPSDAGLNVIQSFFEALELPGTSPFKN